MKKKYSWATGTATFFVMMGVLLLMFGVVNLIEPVAYMFNKYNQANLPTFYRGLFAALACLGGILICILGVSIGKAQLQEQFYNSLVPPEQATEEQATEEKPEEQTTDAQE